MPSSRADVFDAVNALLLAGGVKTVWRGPFFPDDTSLPGDSYPVAGYVDQGDSVYDNLNFGFSIKGEIQVVLWIQTGEVAGPAGGSAGWDQMDALYDAILHAFIGSYYAFHSQVMTIFPTRFEPIYGYRGAEGAAVTFSPAVLTIHFELNYA